MIMPRTVSGQTPYGALVRLAPQAVLSATTGRWPDQLLHVRGASLPVWEGG